MTRLNELKNIVEAWKAHHKRWNRNRIGLPILEVLQFFDWQQRIRLVSALRELAIEHAPAVLPDSWILQRLIEESFVYPVAEFKLPLDHYLGLRHGIVPSIFPKSTRIAAISSRAVISSCIPRCKMGQSYSSSSYASVNAALMRSDDTCNGRTRQMASLFETRICRPQRSPYHLSFSYEDQCVIAESGLTERRFFLDSITPEGVFAIENGVVSEFVNGRNVCIIISGEHFEATERFRKAIDDLIPVLQKAVRDRNCSHVRTKYRGDLHAVLNTFTQSGSETLWCSNDPFNASDAQYFMRMATSSPGHACFRFNLQHSFSAPREGFHENQLTIVVPSIVGSDARSSRSLNLDVLALRRSLRALRSQQSYVPIRESRLTEFIRPDTCDAIEILVCVSNATETSRRESVYGLRFAEQFSSRCTVIH